ncbi:MAG TPA: hypothetical protein VG146_05500 [Verrucomicrobiae bacterium]|nr:hypothetical protein [Verrucomicrobiae bacterium]
MSTSALAGILITNVVPANVTPETFSIIGAVSPVSAAQSFSLSVYSDPAGTTNLAGQIGIEYYPLASGNPLLTNSYDRLLNQSTLRQQSASQGLLYARVSYCAPGTTYYYQLKVTNTNGQSAVWPASGPLPAVTTAQQTSFVLEDLQVVVTVNDRNIEGGIVTISATNSPSVLAAVVGDGAATNQAFFNLNDLLALSGATNLAFASNQGFTAAVLSAAPASLSQPFALGFSNVFLVAQESQLALTPLLAQLSLGSTAALTGTGGSLSVMLNSSAALSGFSLILDMPIAEFSDFFVQPTATLLNAVSLRVIGSHTLQVDFAAPPGQSFVGDQQIARINFNVASNLPSAFISLSPISFEATNTQSLLLPNASASAGRVVVIGSQPLLEGSISNGARLLTLYGIPGDSYQLQFSTNVTAPNFWSNWVGVSLTNLSAIIPNVNSTAPILFYRAYK